MAGALIKGLKTVSKSPCMEAIPPTERRLAAKKLNTLAQFIYSRCETMPCGALPTVLKPSANNDSVEATKVRFGAVDRA